MPMPARRWGAAPDTRVFALASSGGRTPGFADRLRRRSAEPSTSPWTVTVVVEAGPTIWSLASPPGSLSRRGPAGHCQPRSRCANTSEQTEMGAQDGERAGPPSPCFAWVCSRRAIRWQPDPIAADLPRRRKPSATDPRPPTTASWKTSRPKVSGGCATRCRWPARPPRAARRRVDVCIVDRFRGRPKLDAKHGQRLSIVCPCHIVPPAITGRL